MVGTLLALTFSVGWWIRPPEVSIGGDEATYVILSTSLEHGRYHDEFLPGAPPHAKYPPGNPLWIAGIRRVAGASLDALRAANLILFLLTGLLVGDGVRRLTGPWLGVAGVGLTVLNALLLPLAGTGLSEPPYTFLVMLSLWSALRADQQPSRRWVILSSLASISSFLTRTAGLAPVGAIGIWLAFRRRGRALVAHAVASAMVVGGWFAYTGWASGQTIGSTYGLDMKWAGGGGGLAGIPGQLISHAKGYLLSDLPSAFPVPTVPGTVMDNLVWLLLLGGAALTGLIVLSTRWPALIACLALSGGLLLAWTWQITRLLAPLIPSIVVVLVAGWHFWTTKVGGRKGTAVMLAVASIVGIAGVREVVKLDELHQCSRQNPYGDPRCFTPEIRDLVAAARFSHDSLGSAVVVATAKPAPVSYFGGVRTVELGPIVWGISERGAIALAHSGADVILLSGVLSDEQEYARSLMLHCRELEVRAAPTRTTLFLGWRDVRAIGGDACAALQAYLRGPS